MKNVLFITWDGPQVTYLESLFLPIFSSLMSQGGVNFHILQFSWASDGVVSRRRQICEASGCTYKAVSIIRKPVAIGGLITAAMGLWHVKREIKERNIDILLPRSTLPVLTCLLATRPGDIKLVYDADGLPLDERVDFAAQSPSGLVYRSLRDIEAQAVRRADTVLTRSRKAISILQSRAGAGTSEAKFHVVSNGRDKSLFDPGDIADRLGVKKKLGIAADAPLIVYAGSLGPQYCPDSMFRLFSLIRQSRPDSHFLILTGSPEAMMGSPFVSDQALTSGMTVMRVDANEVPRWLAAADLGLAFREPTFSMQGVAPIKLGEYLLCGVPVVATRGVGDSHFIDSQAGFLVDKGDKQTLASVSDWFINHVLPRRDAFRAHCRSVGVAHFSLESSVEAYREALFSIKDQA